jgi:beta-glucosidase
MNAKTVKGLQKSVIACVKHLVGNEQETNRMPLPDGLTAAVSSNIDDRTMHELYLWPFQDAIRAGAGSVMCSYNRVCIPSSINRMSTDMRKRSTIPTGVKIVKF